MANFGIDVHPVYQLLLNFREVRKEGYDFVFVKVSEGKFYIPKGLKRFVRRIKGAGFPVMGYYHFLTRADAAKQARNFIKRVEALGGAENRVLIVDFEPYGSKTPGNQQLKRFVQVVKNHFPGSKVLLYSGQGFWTGGDASGDASDYNVDALWSARYADLEKHENPRSYWDSVKGWWQRVDNWGGTPPPPKILAQFTSTGKVAGKYVDVNVTLGKTTLETLKNLARNKRR